jgi:hypothetical protein
LKFATKWKLNDETMTVIFCDRSGKEDETVKFWGFFAITHFDCLPGLIEGTHLPCSAAVGLGETCRSRDAAGAFIYTAIMRRRRVRLKLVTLSKH